MVTAPGEVGADPSIGYRACLRRELSGEPDVGNLHLRFDEGRVGRAQASPSLLLYPRAQVKERVGRITPFVIVRVEFRPAIPRSGWSPPEPVSASPT